MGRKAPLPFAGASAPRVPKLTKHKASGRAVVCLNGRDCYCGPWGSKEAHLEYDRLISLWLANGRRLDSENADLRIATLVKRSDSPTSSRRSGRSSTCRPLGRSSTVRPKCGRHGRRSSAAKFGASHDSDRWGHRHRAGTMWAKANPLGHVTIPALAHALVTGLLRPPAASEGMLGVGLGTGPTIPESGARQ